MRYIIDTYAWVEYLAGSKKGQRVKEIVHDLKNEIITPECCIAELKGWCIREKGDFERAYLIVRSNSKIESVFTEDWLECAELRAEMRKEKKIPGFGLIDSIILSKQRRHGCMILTGDSHFKDLKNIEHVGE